MFLSNLAKRGDTLEITAFSLSLILLSEAHRRIRERVLGSPSTLGGV
jgi:hypothetical protein